MASARASQDPVVDIAAYVSEEWRGTTGKAERIKKAYACVMHDHRFQRMVRIRGDNYCGLRAVYASIVLNNIELSLVLDETLQRLTAMNNADPALLRAWQFPESMAVANPNRSYEVLRQCLMFLLGQMCTLQRLKDPKEKRKVLCKQLNTGSVEELSIMEGMKLLMLMSAYELHNLNAAGKDVPVFTWLMFARDTSVTPALLLKRHLNSIGKDAGVEQVEMCLLGYSLGVTLQTFRLYQYGEVDFISLFPEDNPKALVPIIAEDDRHYNTLLRQDA